ncbi:uncharacterized protein CIMG_08490 [Coccidioides immitis RS]|uniref:Uncharacterized protein n=3 Tax=Coccidioides immitis TaxID=5501 RepID=J3K5L3_COCIM|nr:uncharacterized protein CIMG_08490 [Coccidioides immitis RS]EAS29744.3 hypothetical protein CIMG_08490 [Coccidioides immitis RS]KMP06758.1 hypothetical protein CIRG_06439 [Coccidioides immitis RMSCC 2394]KMU90495.1 hypothetical protein CIHG_08384 [Coccidioides immitis H538.4]
MATNVEPNTDAYEVQSQVGSEHEQAYPYNTNQQLTQQNGTLRKSRIRDRPESRASESSSLKIKIELDIEAEVDLYARVKGDMNIKVGYSPLLFAQKQNIYQPIFEIRAREGLRMAGLRLGLFLATYDD